MKDEVWVLSLLKHWLVHKYSNTDCWVLPGDANHWVFRKKIKMIGLVRRKQEVFLCLCICAKRLLIRLKRTP